MQEEILKRLTEGNERFVAEKRSGDISSDKRQALFAEGQKPYAVVVTCSDSRVAPELIFDVGLGELFVIRVAGNVISDEVLGSIEYAVDHCGTQVVVVLGHNNCGAVHAAVNRVFDGHVVSLTKAICRAIGEEKDEAKAAVSNVKFGVKEIENRLSVSQKPYVVGAMYDLKSGRAEFLR